MLTARSRICLPAQDQRISDWRTFLMSSAASLPLAAAIETLNPRTISAETIAEAEGKG
jgi:hypothetical protein